MTGKTILLYIVLALALFIPLGAAAGDEEAAPPPPPPLVPQAAMKMVAEINAQMSVLSGDAGNIAMVVTTPQDLNNFESSNPLGRQLQEEMSYLFTRSGYRVQEIRKGANVVFDQQHGESFCSHAIQTCLLPILSTPQLFWLAPILWGPNLSGST